jgi:outer membrane protein OmpA-like peptidoglycan-associated protein
MEVIKIDSDLLFGTNSARLNNDAAAKIEDQIFDRIKERCAIAASIEIGGHTDRQGEEKLMLNLELSQKRALSVAEVLLKKASGALSDPTYACFREKMMTVGYGATSPEQPYSRSAILDVPKNRRVEIKIRDQIKQGS